MPARLPDLVSFDFSGGFGAARSGPRVVQPDTWDRLHQEQRMDRSDYSTAVPVHPVLVTVLGRI